MDKHLYRSLVIVLVIGIILTLTFNLYMRHKVMQQEGFSVLYFEDHKNLPDKLVVGDNFTTEITLVNHELQTEEYVFEVESSIYNYSKDITLNSGEYARFVLDVVVDDRVYNMKFSEERHFDDVISEDGFMAERNDVILKGFSDKYLPVSFNIDRFGEILHTDLDLEELKNNPLESTRSYVSSSDRVYEEEYETMKLYIKDDVIRVMTNIEQKLMISMKEPFVVKFYKVGDKIDNELEVHFWYEVV